MPPVWTAIFSTVGVLSASYGTRLRGLGADDQPEGSRASVWRPRLTEAVGRVRRILASRQRAPAAKNTTIHASSIRSESRVGTPTVLQFENNVVGRLAFLQSQIEGLRTSADEHLRRAQEAKDRLAQQIQRGSRLDTADAQIDP